MAKSLEWKLVREEHYRQFYKEAKNLSTTFDIDVKRKAGLLIRYWPRRFGPGGKQDLEARGYDALQIGGLFNYLLNYSRKYVK